MTVPVTGRALHIGDAVCITGNTATPRDELEARAAGAGLKVTGAVSGKTRLVVAADADYESAKARHARRLGVPLIGEQVFLAMLHRQLQPMRGIGDRGTYRIRRFTGFYRSAPGLG